MSKPDSSDSSSNSNIYRPYVDLSAANPALLNPYLPSGGFNGDPIVFSTVESPQKSDFEVLVSYGAYKFFTTALACPFEVAQTSLQVQHVPISSPKCTETENESDQSSEDSEESDDDQLPRSKRSKDQVTASSIATGKVVATDQYGYVVESSSDDGTRPLHQLPVLRYGVWNTIRTIVKHPDEGFFSLWKGQFVYWFQDIAQLFLQPTIETALNDVFNLYDDTIPLTHIDSVLPNIMTILASNLAVGIILNPLNIIRTRLIVQSSKPSLKKYSGPIDAISTIIQEEGARTLFWGKDIMPCILYNLLDPFFVHCTPLIIDRWFHLNFAESPLYFSLAELAMSTLQISLTLPLETICKRLQIQNQSKIAPTKPFVSMVRTRQIAYASAVDCAYRVATEEAFPSPLNKKIRPASFYTAHGLGALYKGFGFEFKSVLLTTVISNLTGIKDDGEW